MLWMFLEALLPHSPLHLISHQYPTNTNTTAQQNGPSGFSNDLFGTGIGLMVASAFLTLLQTQLVSAWEHAGSAHAEVYVESDDEAFSYLVEYLATNPHLIKERYTLLETIVGYIKFLLSVPFELKKRKIPSYSSNNSARSVICKTAYENKETKKPSVFYVPNDGTYSVMHQGTDISFSITSDEKPIKSGNPSHGGSDDEDRPEAITSGSKKTTIILSSYSRTDGATKIQDLIQTSIDAFFAKNQGKTSVFALEGTWGHEFRRFVSRQSRQMDSIILNPELKSTIIKDVENFLQSENWYQSMGIPYRRGYILHGPPGTGKTSFIFALAGHLKMDLSLVNLTLPNLTDSELASALCDSPQNSILVFEDIDVAMAKKKKKKGGDGDDDESSESRVTLSGLLNALDGLIAQEGRIVFMTTNNIGSLPAALLRPGRVDRRFHFPNATVDVAIGLFVRFYGLTLGVEEAYRIGSVVVEKLLIPEKEYGIAQLQGFYSRHRDDPAGIIDCVDDFLKEIQEQQQSELQDQEDRDKSEKETSEKKEESKEE